MKIKHSLRFRTLFGIVLISFFLTALAIFLSYRAYVQTMDEHYSMLAQNVADTAAIGLDGDKIQGYYEAYCALDSAAEDYDARLQAIKDADYQRMLRYLSGVRKANNVLYLYVEVLDFDKQTDTYIMDADTSETACELGYTETFGEEVSAYEGQLDQGIPPSFSDTEEFGALVTSARPVLNSRGEVAAMAVVDISMEKVKADRMSFLIHIMLFLALAGIAVALGSAALINRLIVHPVNCLASATASYTSEGDSSAFADGASAIEALDIHTGDEIENLCRSVKKMEQDIRRYIQNLTAVTAEKEHISAELDVAKHIQASMLPCIFPAFPERSELDIYASMTPAKEVGGDFYDFFLIDDDHLALVMADVSGKGIPAALFMVIAKTLLKNVAQTGISPKQVLEKVNDQLCVNNEAEMFVTVWLGILQISTGKLTCANAGHEYPVLKRAQQAFELLKDKHGFVLAGMEGTHYREYELQLEPGDRLFLYTDGVTEATDAENQLYGTDRMLAALNRSENTNCEELLYAIKADIDAFVGGAPQFDDITMLSLEYKEKSAPKEVTQ